jgi:ribosomal protein S18 acetylase RimI-like enzyme
MCPRTPEHHFSEIARIHKSSLDHKDFLGECGLRFIRFFYRQVSRFPSSCLLTKELDGAVAGFAFISADKYINRFLKRYAAHLLFFPSTYLPLVRAVAGKTVKKVKLAAAKLSGAKSSRAGLAGAQLPGYDAEIVYLAIDPAFKSRGIATQLFMRGERKLKEAGYHEYYSQVFQENHAAVNLHRKLGFSIVMEFPSAKGMKYLMKKAI